MAGKLSELMTETGFGSQTSFSNLILDDIGEVSDTGVAVSDFKFTGISFSPTSLGTLTITTATPPSTTSTLSRTGAGTFALWCDTNTTTLNKTYIDGGNGQLLQIKKGGTEVIASTGTSGTIVLDGSSDSITFQSVNYFSTSTGNYTLDAEYVGAFNGTITTGTDVTITVTDNYPF